MHWGVIVALVNLSRRLGNVPLTFVWLVWLTLGGLWVRSAYVVDQVGWSTDEGRVWTFSRASMGDGKVCFIRCRQEFSRAPAEEVVKLTQPEYAGVPLGSTVRWSSEPAAECVEPQPTWSCLGVAWSRQRTPRKPAFYNYERPTPADAIQITSLTTQITIPLWMVEGALAVPLVLWFREMVRRRRVGRALAEGRCPKCEYDMRASGDVCPECGTRRRTGDVQD